MPGKAGERDRYVTIEQLNEQKGASGYPVETWTTLAFAWMSKQDAGAVYGGARERFSAGQTSAPFDTRWEMSYRADMDPELVNVPKVRRLSYQGRTYDIVAASQVGRRMGVEILTLARMG